MLSRRHFIAGSASLALASCARDLSPLPFSSGSDRPRIVTPAGACDSHIHILDPRFPATPGWRGPPVDEATVAVYRRVQARIGTERVVVVTPSTYGVDNRATLDALARIGENARGVAVIDADAPPANLARLAHAGVRGLRVNFVSPQPWGRSDVARLRKTAKIAASVDWHVQIFARSSDLLAMETDIAGLDVPVVIDHLGFVPPENGVNDPGHQAILRLLENGRTWLKLSGAYISSRSGAPDHADLLPIARSYVRHAPERLVWGSDWPHRGQSAHWPDDAALIDLLLEWALDTSVRNQILVTNPAHLYGFP